MQRKVFVVTGNTGTGKTTVTKYLNDFFEMPQVITHTTRAPREGELDQVDYYFESRESFPHNHYLESVVYNGQQYGSSLEGLERAWAKNPLITIVLDTAGAATYAAKLPADEVEIIYLTVSEPDVLAARLAERGDDVQAIKNRLASDEYQRDQGLPAALAERAKVVVNDDLTATKAKINELVQAAVQAEAH